MSRQIHKKSKQIRVNYYLWRYLRIKGINDNKTVGEIVKEAFQGDYIEPKYD